MTQPGMRERTMRIGSAGKTFSLTGWKDGYVAADANLCPLIQKVHQNLTFTTAFNLQQAVALGVGKDDAYFASLAAGLQERRDQLAGGLASVGFEVLPTRGTYFITIDFRPLGFNGDVAFCRHIMEKGRRHRHTRLGVLEAPIRRAITPALPSASGRKLFPKQ